MSKQPAVYFPSVGEKIFIVHLIVHGEVVQVDPVGVYFFTLLGLLVHYHGDSVL